MGKDENLAHTTKLRPLWPRCICRAWLLDFISLLPIPWAQSPVGWAGVTPLTIQSYSILYQIRILPFLLEERHNFNYLDMFITVSLGPLSPRVHSQMCRAARTWLSFCKIPLEVFLQLHFVSKDKKCAGWLSSRCWAGVAAVCCEPLPTQWGFSYSS